MFFFKMSVILPNTTTKVTLIILDRLMEIVGITWCHLRKRMAASGKEWRGGGSEFRHKDAPMCCTLAPVTALPTPGGIMEKLTPLDKYTAVCRIQQHCIC